MLKELRELRTWQQPAGRMLLDFKITLEAVGEGEEEVVLDGNAHHAGFQFRAVQEVAQRSKETSYLRPTSARSKGNDIWTDCPWTVCRFRVGGRSYAVMYMDHPENPEPAEMSTRPYARFGAFSRHRLKPLVALELRYRILIVDETNSTPLEEKTFLRLYQNFAHPPTAGPAQPHPR